MIPIYLAGALAGVAVGLVAGSFRSMRERRKGPRVIAEFPIYANCRCVVVPLKRKDVRPVRPREGETLIDALAREGSDA